MLKGRIDECRGRYIFGWAVPAPRNPHCAIVVKDSAGHTIANVIACGSRADLALVGDGRIDFAFKVGVPLGVAPVQVQVFADGVEFVESPLSFAPDIFDGALVIRDGVAAGWICSRGMRPVTKDVSLIDQDGVTVVTASTRLEPSDADPMFRPARFSVALPARCFGGSEFSLSVRVDETIVARRFGVARLTGHLDQISDSLCSGWLFSPDAPARRFDIGVYRDGVLAGTGQTALPRGDVLREYPQAGVCGFAFPLLPTDREAAGLTHLSIRLAGSPHELFEGPFLLGSCAQAIGDLCSDEGDGNASAIRREALASWLHHAREGCEAVRIHARPLATEVETVRRLAIVIPCFGDVAATRRCFDSVLRARRLGRDLVVIVNDNPDDVKMGELIDAQERHPDVFVLRNDRNLGFVLSVNRAMAFVRSGDVLLLNADTEVFAGSFDEMVRVLYSAPDIGTVTALSSNATLFTYPHPDVVEKRLDDVAWAELAAVALRENAGTALPIPTTHGFCMLIRRALLGEIGLMDTAFGRGYGEENDFSLRATDRGWRHVVAGGVLVRHDEAGSFGAEKVSLAAANLRLVSQRFPEYGDRVQAFAAADPVRRLRWPLDFHRLRRVRAGGTHLELVIESWLEGGTALAAADLSAVVKTPEVGSLHLNAAPDGSMLLRLDGFAMRSVFRPEDVASLFALLETLELSRVVVHHLIGFSQDFVRALKVFIAGRRSVFHVHDYYYACPRVTLIDASGAFCGGAVDRCDRCVQLGGSHAAHRMADLQPDGHRALFRDLLAQAGHVVAPSVDAARRLAILIPGLCPIAIAHPQASMVFPIGVRRGSATDICVLGAIDPHKGSAPLLALARHAWLSHPGFRFHVIGHTDIDEALLAVGNVGISGKYEREDLPRLVEATGARIALFLHGWPETFSYTLTEAVGLGLIPVVPDIGAPAERIREAGFGVVVPFPIDVAVVMSTLRGLGDGTIAHCKDGGLPLGFDTSHVHDRLRSVYRGADLTEAEAAIWPRRRWAAVP